MKFISGMVWSEKYLKWGFWTEKKVVVDCSNWSEGAARQMWRNLWSK